jgi:hypothetical protein
MVIGTQFLAAVDSVVFDNERNRILISPNPRPAIPANYPVASLIPIFEAPTIRFPGDGRAIIELVRSDRAEGLVLAHEEPRELLSNLEVYEFIRTSSSFFVASDEVHIGRFHVERTIGETGIRFELTPAEAPEGLQFSVAEDDDAVQIIFSSLLEMVDVNALQLPDPVAVNDGEALECAICLEDITESGQALNRCVHKFHLHCIQRWLRMNHQDCPTCRANVRPPQEPDSDEK